jgi:DNA-binding NarL/FixJ family response regulator
MLRILIVDDHALVRRGVRQVISEGLGKTIIGEARSVQEALNLVWKEKWDVVVADITLPGRSGVDLLREIKAARPKLPVLIQSMHTEEEFGVRVIKAGAAGFITKESAPEELVKAIQQVLTGKKYVSSALAERMAQYLEIDTERPLHESLSDREYEVLRLIASGKAPKEIAQGLSLSIKTVSTYRARILEKMRLHTNAELTHYAFKHQLVG